MERKRGRGREGRGYETKGGESLRDQGNEKGGEKRKSREKGKIERK